MTDQTVAKLIAQEANRQRGGLELIPSENYVSRGVLEALGSEFTNKYAEGYPGARYYGGQEFTDRVEQLAIDRAKSLFGADHANVQPHSGAPANLAVYGAWLEPGDTVLAMELSHGGHLTHGAPVTYAARLYNFVRYGMKNPDTGEIDYDQLADIALKTKPKLIIAGFSAYPRELDYGRFAGIGRAAGALLMADMAHIAGLIAGGVLANPLAAGFQVMTATTHKTLRGPRGGLILSRGQTGSPLKDPGKSINNIPVLIDRQVFPGLQGGPHMNVIAAKAVALGEAAQADFKLYCRQVLDSARALAQELSRRGFYLVTGGTDNHLILADVRKSFNIDGAEAQAALDAVGLNVNKNAVPDDPLPPFRPSGIRLGTPAVVTRGLTPEHMPQLAEWISLAVKSRKDATALAGLRRQVDAFARQFPLPSDRP